jgi:hypothetical protein
MSKAIRERKKKRRNRTVGLSQLGCEVREGTVFFFLIFFVYVSHLAQTWRHVQRFPPDATALSVRAMRNTTVPMRMSSGLRSSSAGIVHQGATGSGAAAGNPSHDRASSVKPFTQSIRKKKIKIDNSFEQGGGF